MRINCVDVQYLSDQHLRAEWVEMLMLPAYLRRSFNSKGGLIFSEKTKYILGTGHARFFYNKVLYCMDRYYDIMIEMQKRGFKTNHSLIFPDYLPSNCFGAWEPNTDDIHTNLNRIIARIQVKPNWYSYYGQKISDWPGFYESKIQNYIWKFNTSYIGRK